MKGLSMGIVAMALLAGCASNADFKERSLYQRLGGRGAIVAMTDDFTASLARDPRLQAYFAGASMERKRKMLADQISFLSGGAYVYGGLDMKTAHAGCGIDEAGFNVFMEALGTTLAKFKVPAKEKAELLALFQAMQKDIVTK